MSDDRINEVIVMVTEVGHIIQEAIKKLEEALVLIGLPERKWDDLVFLLDNRNGDIVEDEGGESDNE